MDLIESIENWQNIRCWYPEPAYDITVKSGIRTTTRAARNKFELVFLRVKSLCLRWRIWTNEREDDGTGFLEMNTEKAKLLGYDDTNTYWKVMKS